MKKNLEVNKKQQASNAVISITAVVILLALYGLRNTFARKTDDEEISVSLCQVHVALDEPTGFDDQALLSLLAAFKRHDFQIGQPVWGPSNILLYLCEHRLKEGLKLSSIDHELQTIMKNSGASSKRIVWSCA